MGTSGLIASVVLAAPREASESGASGAWQSGAELAYELGCGACHSGLSGPGSIRAAAPLLGPARPLAVQYVFDYLENPRRVSTDIGRARMPDFRLGAPERLALAFFLAPGTDSVPGETAALTGTRQAFPDLSPADGEHLFRSLNCAGCHAHPDVAPARVGPDMSRVGARLEDAWLRSYLRAPQPVRPGGDPPGSGSRMPDFRLDGNEADVLATFLRLQNPPAFRPTPLPARSLSPFAMSKAATMLRDQLACLGCHSLGGEGGRAAPAFDGMGERVTDGYARAMVSNPSTHVSGTVMPGSLLQDDDQELVVRYLLQRPGAWAPAEDVFGFASGQIPWAGASRPAGATRAANGEAVYSRYCALCHGPTGMGDGFNAGFLPTAPTAHADSAYMSTRPDDTLFDGIYAGGAILDRSHRMPAFAQTLSRSQIRAVVTYMRELCGCEGPSWSRGGAD